MQFRPGGTHWPGCRGVRHIFASAGSGRSPDRARRRTTGHNVGQLLAVALQLTSPRPAIACSRSLLAQKSDGHPGCREGTSPLWCCRPYSQTRKKARPAHIPALNGGDGGNRTRVRRIRPRTSTSLVGPCQSPGSRCRPRCTRASRWEPKLPLGRSYRHLNAARRLYDALLQPVGERSERTLPSAAVICPWTGLGCQRSSRERGLRDGNPGVPGTLESTLRFCGVRAPRLAVRDQPSPSKPVIPRHLYYSASWPE